MIRQAVILAGGFGTRLSEETDFIPKPMIQIGGIPILVHIMNWYSKFGVNNFIILAGYKAEIIKNYFLNFRNLSSDFTVDLSSGDVKYFDGVRKDWRVSIFNTGLNTMTGGRLKRVEPHLHETFFFTYGDGVSDVDLHSLLASHKRSQKSVTLTRVISPERYGVLQLTGDLVSSFVEKPTLSDRWINAGYFVVNREAVKEIEGDLISWEQEPLQSLAKKSQLNSYPHSGFWKPMDTLRDKRELEELVVSGHAPWLT